MTAKLAIANTVEREPEGFASPGTLSLTLGAGYVRSDEDPELNHEDAWNGVWTALQTLHWAALYRVADAATAALVGVVELKWQPYAAADKTRLKYAFGEYVDKLEIDADHFWQWPKPSDVAQELDSSQRRSVHVLQSLAVQTAPVPQTMNLSGIAEFGEVDTPSDDFLCLAVDKATADALPDTLALDPIGDGFWIDDTKLDAYNVAQTNSFKLDEFSIDLGSIKQTNGFLQLNGNFDPNRLQAIYNNVIQETGSAFLPATPLLNIRWGELTAKTDCRTPAWFARSGLVALFDGLLSALFSMHRDGKIQGMLRLELLHQLEKLEALQDYSEEELLHSIDQGFLSVFNFKDEDEFIDHLLLASDLREKDEDEEQFVALIKDPAVLKSMALIPGVVRVLQRIANRVQEEQGITTTLREMLSREDASGGLAIQAILGALGAAGNETTEAAIAAGLNRFLVTIEDEFDVQSAIRDAYSRTVVRLLFSQDLSAVEDLDSWVRGAITNTDFFACRYGLRAPTEHPLSHWASELGNVAPIEWLDGETADDNKHLQIIHDALTVEAMELGEITAPGTDRQFQPTLESQPLAIQITAIASEDCDAFNQYFNGVGAMLKFGGEPEFWSYLDLADLSDWYNTSELNEFGNDVIHPSRMHPVDGMLSFRLAYHGYGLHSLQGTDRLPEGAEQKEEGAEGQVPTRTLFKPNDPLYGEGGNQFRPPPALAYGASYDLVTYVISKSGALPKTLQLGRRWQPNPRLMAHPPMRTLDYKRQTVLGSATFEPEATGWKVNTFPKGTFPMFSVRRVIAAYNNEGIERHLDLFRAKDGRGEIQIPQGDWVEVNLADGWPWRPDDAGVKVRVAVYRTGSVPDAPFAMAEFEWPAGAHFALSLGTDPEERAYQIPTDTSQVEMVWLRIKVLSSDAGATMLDPTTSAMDQPQDPLLVLFPSGGSWKSHEQDREKLAINGPRTQAIVFDRWLQSTALLAEHCPGGEEERESLFQLLDIVSVAQSVGGSNESVYKILGRLPEPAMDKLIISATPLDTVALAPSEATRKRLFAVGSVALPKLGPIAKTLLTHHPLLFEYVAKIRVSDDPDALKDPKEFAEDFLQLFEEFDALWTQKQWNVVLDEDTSSDVAIDATNKTIRLPSGGVFSLELLMGVKKANLEGVNAPLDRRFNELADAEDGKHFYFSNSRLIVETASAPDASLHGLVQDLLRLEPQGSSRTFRLMAPAQPQYWQLRQLHEAQIDQQRWRDLGVPLRSWINPRDHQDTGREIIPAADSESHHMLALNRDDPIKVFEAELFNNRDTDVFTETAVLLPSPADSILVKESWDNATATYFRYKARFYSRYRGMLQSSDAIATEDWLAVAMLAQKPHASLSSPPVRALIPLMQSQRPDEQTPGLLAVIQEPPYARGGLAERLDADIKLGISYQIEAVSDTISTNRVLDAAAESGELAFRTHRPKPDAVRQTLRVKTKSPAGLTYDSPSTVGQVFSNTMLVVMPTDRTNATLDHHAMALQFIRRLDPNWLVDGKLTGAPFPFQSQLWIEYAPFDENGGNMLSFRTPNSDEDLNIMSAETATDADNGDLLFNVRSSVIDTRQMYTSSESVTIFRSSAQMASAASFYVAYTGLDETHALIALYVKTPDERVPQRCAAIQIARPEGRTNASVMAPNAKHFQVGCSSLPTEALWTRTLTDRNFLSGQRACDDDVQRLPITEIRWRRSGNTISASSDGFTVRPMAARRHPNTHQIQYAIIVLDTINQRGHYHQVFNTVKRVIGNSAISELEPKLAQASLHVAIVEYLIPATIGLNAKSPAQDGLSQFQMSRLDVYSKTGPTAAPAKALRASLNLVGAKTERSINQLTLKFSELTDEYSITIDLQNPDLLPVDELHLVIQAEASDGEQPDVQGTWIEDNGDPHSISAKGSLPLSSEGFDVAVEAPHGNELWFEYSWLLDRNRLGLYDFDFDWLLPWTDRLNVAETEAIDWSEFVKESAMKHQREVQAILFNVSPTRPLFTD